jgi:hypothetical protein
MTAQLKCERQSQQINSKKDQMTLYYYIILTFVAAISYMMVVDKNIITYIELTFQFAVVQLKRVWWIVRFHPINPIPRWTLNRRIERMTRELEEKLKIVRKHLTDDE